MMSKQQQYLQDPISCSLCDIPLPGQEVGGSLVANSLEVREVFKNVADMRITV